MAYAGHTTIIIPKPLVSYVGLEILDLGKQPMISSCFYIKSFSWSLLDLLEALESLKCTFNMLKVVISYMDILFTISYLHHLQLFTSTRFFILFWFNRTDLQIIYVATGYILHKFYQYPRWYQWPWSWADSRYCSSCKLELFSKYQFDDWMSSNASVITDFDTQHHANWSICRSWIQTSPCFLYLPCSANACHFLGFTFIQLVKSHLWITSEFSFSNMFYLLSPLSL